MPELSGVLTGDQVRATIASIAAEQDADGALPWFRGGQLDPWDSVEAAMALVDVVRSDELDRLRVCDADDCSDVLVDLSKNRSRRYCDAGCGNRVNVAAYRARRAGAGV